METQLINRVHAWRSRSKSGAMAIMYLLISCASVFNNAQADMSYDDIINMEQPDYESGDTDPIRTKAIQDVAYQLALQSAVKERYTQIIALLNSIAADLDTLTAFKPLMIDDYAMPPVITSTDGTIRLINQAKVVQTDKSYKILKPSVMVLRPPTWRDYLLHVLTPVEKPHIAVLPNTAHEKDIWKAATKRGWTDGVTHANRLFQLRWKHLITDYIGMVNYHVLATQQMVSNPQITSAIYPVRMSEDGKELEINKQLWHIAKPTGFTDPAQWHVIVSSQQETTP